MQTAKQHEATTLYLLQTVPGMGTILRLVLPNPAMTSGLFRAFGEAGLRGTSGIYPCAELFYHILPSYSLNSHCRPAWHVPRVACRLPLL